MAHLGENRWGHTPEQLDENTPPDAERKGFFDPGRLDRLVVDGDQIRAFVDAVFRYASPGLFISLRTFRNGGSPDIRVVKTKGPDREELIDAATKQAQKAANSGVNAVFCPPLAGFSSRDKADEAHLSESYVLTVECDERPGEARQKLEDLLGPATIVVASGGRWADPETGEVEDKLHLYWRLNEPAIGGDLARLKAARRLAAEIVGADMSNVTVVHPIRWPGSWHRKGEPRLARIVAATQNEIALADALERLQAALPPHSEKPNGKAGGLKGGGGGGGEGIVFGPDGLVVDGREAHLTQIVYAEASALSAEGGALTASALGNRAWDAFAETTDLRDGKWTQREAFAKARAVVRKVEAGKLALPRGGTKPTYDDRRRPLAEAEDEVRQVVGAFFAEAGPPASWKAAQEAIKARREWEADKAKKQPCLRARAFGLP